MIWIPFLIFVSLVVVLEIARRRCVRSINESGRRLVLEYYLFKASRLCGNNEKCLDYVSARIRESLSRGATYVDVEELYEDYIKAKERVYTLRENP